MRGKQKAFLLEDTTYQKKKIETGIIEFVVGVFLLFGMILSFMTLLQDLDGVWVLFLVAMISLGVLTLTHDKAGAELISGIVILGISLLLLVVNGGGAFRGLIYWMNQMITAWNTKYDDYTSLFQLSSISNTDRLVFSIIAILVAAFLLDKLIHKRAVIILTILIFAVLFATLVVGLHRGIGGVLFLVTGWLLFWMMDILSHQALAKTLTILALLLLVLGGVSFATRSYTSNNAISNVKASILSKIDRTRYGEDALPKGDMTKASAMLEDKETTRLQISFEEAQEMYLKGFIGSEYDGKKWMPLNEGAYATDTSAGMLDWLKDQGFSAVNQYIEYEGMVSGSTPDTKAFSVNNTGAYRKYLYTPYELATLDARGEKEMFDWQYQSSGLLGVRSYDFTSTAPETPNDLMITQNTSNASSTKYVEAENVYRTFVYENYLTIDDALKTTLQDTFFAGENWDKASAAQVTNQIRIVLQGLTKYSDSPYAYNGNKEFITWFLNEEKLGNASYFATAATMAYRTAGIPARYVEGYYLSAADAEDLNDGGVKNALITGGDAHAWTEIYMDGIGWMPVEVAPGFYYAEYTTQQVLDAPQSSVSVTNQDDQEELQGSTTDQLESKKDDKPKEETVIHKTVRVLGILLAVAILLEAFWLIVQLQQRIRKGLYAKKMRQSDNNQKAKILYDHICKLFAADKISGNSDFPYERGDEIAEKYESIDKSDYERVLSLMQKSKFGGAQLEDYELDTVQAFTDKIGEEGMQKAGKLKQFIRKYFTVL